MSRYVRDQRHHVPGDVARRQRLALAAFKPPWTTDRHATPKGETACPKTMLDVFRRNRSLREKFTLRSSGTVLAA